MKSSVLLEGLPMLGKMLMRISFEFVSLEIRTTYSMRVLEYSLQLRVRKNEILYIVHTF